MSTETCTPLTVDFIVRDTDPEMAVVEDDITKDLAKVGITVKIKFLPAEEYIAAEKDGNYHMLFSRTWVSCVVWIVSCMRARSEQAGSSSA